MLSLERGEIQMLPFVTVTSDLRRLKDDKNIFLTDKGYEGIGPLNWLAFNLERKPLSDVKVRKAIATAIDKKFITKALMGGFATVADGPIVPSSPLASSDLVRYPFDLKKAAAMLDEAGYKADSNGERFKLTIDYLPGPDDQQKQRGGVHARPAEEDRRHGRGARLGRLPGLGQAAGVARFRHVDGPGLQLGRSGHRRAPHLPVEQHPPDRLDQHAVVQEQRRSTSC